MTEVSRVITLSALGRPFTLDMLYECRDDQLIPGITLWNKRLLESELVKEKQESAEFEIFANESINEKANQMGVNAELKLSFMAGAIQVAGSAKYLDDKKSTNNKARVTLQYKCSTQIEQRTMEHLGRRNDEHPYVFDQGTATHVVTGIQYGGQA